jgi:hypothetical protein
MDKLDTRPLTEAAGPIINFYALFGISEVAGDDVFQNVEG